MIESLWAPGLAVLAAGLAVGVWAARRLAAGKRSAAGAATGQAAGDRRDLELAIADLEARRDQIYAQLRGEGEDAASEGDRRALELAAARTLRQLEEKRAALAPHLERPGRRKKKKGRRAPEPSASDAGAGKAAPPAAAGFAARHPLVAGFLLGSGMVAVVGVLVYWAVRDAQPQAPAGFAAAPPAAVAGGVSPEEAHGGLDDLPITLRVELDALNERVAAGDRMALRERALFYLGIERYVEAFDDSRALLAADPQDIDGLYVQGVVRLTMGQDDMALELFDRVIGLYPDHVQALVWRGILHFRAGDRDGALAAWRRGLEAAGGSQPEIEGLIRSAEQSDVVPSPPPDAAAAVPPAAAPPPTAPATAAPAPAVPADVYGVRVTIADGAFPPPGGILFVSLRPADGGPPVAVKRIDRVDSFPLDLTISAADSMMGQGLPASGIVRVRLDADGSASTRSPDDLEAEAEALQGGAVSLVLG